jgi:myo-inositol 2-dehydrogenase/D-chiro-inositol 1-dehydrogenase
MTRLRFAQAGVSALHATMYRETLGLLADEIELVGFYDPAPDAVRPDLTPAHADIPFYDTLGALLADARPDAVLVSTYSRDMPDWMAQVAEAGVNLWAEKPCAAAARQLTPVAAALARNGLHFSCGYSWRFHPITQLIKETYDAGLLGKPYSIEFRFITSSIKQRDPANWLFDPERSGGGILNWLGCHWFDLMRHLTGSEATHVAAIEANVSGDAVGVEDAASVSLRLANGMIGSLHTGYFTDGDGEVAIALRGSSGWVRWDVAAGRCTIKSGHPAWATAPTRTFDIPTAKLPGYGAEGRALIRAFAAAIRGEGASGYTIDDPIRALQIIEAAHESSRTGRTITL